MPLTRLLQDEDGDDVAVSSDAELSLAINLYKGSHGGTVKLTLSPISPIASAVPNIPII